MDKAKRRIRKKKRLRKHLIGTDQRPRVSVFKSSLHTYAQVVSDQSNTTLLSASTLDKKVQAKIKSVNLEELHSKATSSKSVAAAQAAGLLLAELLKQQGIEEVVFDRNGYVYQGRVQAIAEGVRAGGIRV